MNTYLQVNGKWNIIMITIAMKNSKKIEDKNQTATQQTPTRSELANKLPSTAFRLSVIKPKPKLSQQPIIDQK